MNTRLLTFLNKAVHESNLSEDDEALHALCQSCNKIDGKQMNRLNMIKSENGYRSWKSIR